MTTTRSPQIDLGQRTVGEVMRLGVVTCAPDTPLSEVARLMGAYRIHCVVVGGLSEEVDGMRLVWGVVSTSIWRAPSRPVRRPRRVRSRRRSRSRPRRSTRSRTSRR